MPPRMMTQSVGRSTAAPRGGRTGGQIGRGCGRTGEPTGRVGGQTGDQDGQVGDRGNRANGGIDKVPGLSTVIAQQLQNLLPTIIAQGGAIVYTRWIEKMESFHDMSGCGDNQKVKYTANSFINKALTWCNSQVQTRGRESAVGMTWEDFKTLTREELCPNNEMQKLETKFWCHAMIRVMVAATEPTTIQSDVLKAEMLTDEAIRNGSLKTNTEKR
ncbi:hypothetical protein Tco_0931860 [Tanacetum coccineum]